MKEDDKGKTFSSISRRQFLGAGAAAAGGHDCGRPVVQPSHPNKKADCFLKDFSKEQKKTLFSENFSLFDKMS